MFSIITPCNLFVTFWHLTVKRVAHHLSVCISLAASRTWGHLSVHRFDMIRPGWAPGQTDSATSCQGDLSPQAFTQACHQSYVARGSCKRVSTMRTGIRERPGYKNSHLFPSGLGWLPQLSPRTAPFLTEPPQIQSHAAPTHALQPPTYLDITRGRGTSEHKRL